MWKVFFCIQEDYSENVIDNEKEKHTDVFVFLVKKEDFSDIQGKRSECKNTTRLFESR